jgi:hypothetical protein
MVCEKVDWLKTRNVTKGSPSVTLQPLSNIMKTSNQTQMNIQSTTAMNTSSMPLRNPATNAYWKSVKLCVAKPDGSAEIHHMDGHVERFDANLVGNKALVTLGSQSRDALRHGGSQFCHAILMKGGIIMNDGGNG